MAFQRLISLYASSSCLPICSHKAVSIGGDKQGDGAGGSGGSGAASKARSLPPTTIAQILSSQLGQPVSPTASGINGGVASIFGGDAGKLMMQFAASQMGGGKAGGGNPLAALLGGGGQPGGGAGGAAAMIGGMAMAAMAGGGKPGGGQGNPLVDILGKLGLGGTNSATAAGSPPFQPTDDPLGEDCGILVTGCENTQTSADVRPSGGKPHGALTAAISKAFRANPNCTYRQLVLAVRADLHSGGFSQNPQLECSSKNADLPFICGGNSPSEAATCPPPAARDAPSDNAAEEPPSGGKTDAAGMLSSLFKTCFKG
jgi:Caspase domain